MRGEAKAQGWLNSKKGLIGIQSFVLSREMAGAIKTLRQ